MVMLQVHFRSFRVPSVQLEQIGGAQDSSEQSVSEQLQTLLVLDLHQPAGATATAFGATPGSSGGSTHVPAASASASAERQGAVLADPVLHVAYGGGPHLLLAACTRDTLVVVSLEGLAAHLYQQQTCGEGGSGGGGASVAEPQLWHQLTAVHCGAADVLAIRWGWLLGAPGKAIACGHCSDLRTVCNALLPVPRLLRRPCCPYSGWQLLGSVLSTGRG